MGKVFKWVCITLSCESCFNCPGLSFTGMLTHAFDCYMMFVCRTRRHAFLPWEFLKALHAEYSLSTHSSGQTTWVQTNLQACVCVWTRTNLKSLKSVLVYAVEVRCTHCCLSLTGLPQMGLLLNNSPVNLQFYSREPVCFTKRRPPPGPSCQWQGAAVLECIVTHVWRLEVSNLSQASAG